MDDKDLENEELKLWIKSCQTWEAFSILLDSSVGNNNLWNRKNKFKIFIKSN